MTLSLHASVVMVYVLWDTRA